MSLQVETVSIKDELKNIVTTALEGTASSIFVNQSLAVLDQSADSQESFMAAAERIRSRVALFIDEDLSLKLFAILNEKIRKMDLIPGTRRRHVRVPFRNRIRLNYSGMAYHFYTTDISEGGVNIEADKPFPVGSVLEIILPLKAGDFIAVSGSVVNIKSGRGLRSAGMGVKFRGVSDLSLTILRGIIKSASDQCSIPGRQAGPLPSGK